MSAKIAQSNDVPRDESIEEQMKRILSKISNIDEKTKRLAQQRETLMHQYEQLKDAKFIRDAKACDDVDQNWEHGMHAKHEIIVGPLHLIRFANLFFSFHFQKILNGHSAYEIQ